MFSCDWREGGRGKQEDCCGKDVQPISKNFCLNPLKAELNPIRHLLALVGARHIVHVSRVGLKS